MELDEEVFMSDFPNPKGFNHPSICTNSPESIGMELTSVQGTFTTGAVWPGANHAIFVPFIAYSLLTVVKMFTYNGAAQSGNMDIGIYDDTQNLVVSKGSTAMSGTNVIQEFDITDTTLRPGLYYMALCVDNTTAQFFRANLAVNNVALTGTLNQTLGSVTLTSTATFAKATDGYIPLFGLTTRTTV